ncbi:MAG TPA: hypothetical protein VKK79_17060, partial [Candidatus Lokiarchaeia archaeon]|nr:hypothetical protein [Candidatus Lokiarchaeia archaeon]
MIWQSSDLFNYFDLIILLIFLGSCISVPIARARQERQRRQAAQMLQQMQEHPEQAYAGMRSMPPNRRPSGREEKVNEE